MPYALRFRAQFLVGGVFSAVLLQIWLLLGTTVNLAFAATALRRECLAGDYYAGKISERSDGPLARSSLFAAILYSVS